MEMSPQYADETAAVMASRGYQLRTDSEDRMDGSELRFNSTRHRLTADQRELIMEILQYPDGEIKYFLEIANYSGLSSFSFELDSWKHRDDYVEFSYYTNPETGTALTFKLTYPDSH